MEKCNILDVDLGTDEAAKAALISDGPVDPMTRIRNLCRSRGAHGIIGLSRIFRNIDDDGSKALNFQEFSRGILEIGLNFSSTEIREIFDVFDEDGSGSIDMTEFLVKLRPPMSEERLSVVGEAFEKMDKTGNGVLTLEDLKDVYSVEMHPKFISGEMTEDEILTIFLYNFKGCRGAVDGIVTKEQFIEYYTAISASIDLDEYFVEMMRRAYRL